MTLQNEPFEELLSNQLARQLEPQRGRALAAFQAQLAAEERAAAKAGGSRDKRAWARGEVSRGGAWMWVGLPSAVAAALAVAVTLHFTRVPGGTGAGGDGGVQVAVDKPILEGRSPERALPRETQIDPVRLAGFDGPGVRVLNGNGNQQGQNAGFTVIRLNPPDQAYPLNPLPER